MALDRQRIITEAIGVLDENGLDGVTVRKLAQRLGVQAPTLYWHIRNKAELTLQLHEMCVASGDIAHRLAKETNLAQTGTAFICGLLSEIGAMCCLVFDGKDYVQL